MGFLEDNFGIDQKRFDGPVLVTGAGGCLGAWTLGILRNSGVPAIAFDLADDRRRPALVMGDEAASEIVWETGDITDREGFEAIVRRHEVQAIIHYAGLQVPFCKADPALGARVNVEGTINVLETARQTGIRRTAYASSVAAHGFPPESPSLSTLYGAYKLANEHTAHVYFQDWQVPSVGIRPNVVYGVARDQGISAKFTLAIQATVLGQPYEIPFSGLLSWLHAGEAAAAFIAAVSQDGSGAPVFDLNGSCHEVSEGLAVLQALAPDANVTISGKPFPFPQDMDDAPLRAHVPDYPSISMAAGIQATFEAFAKLHAQGRLPSLT